jgi:hypothetical protein
VRLEGGDRVTTQPVETVSGRFSGGIPERLLLYVNGTPIALRVTGRSFATLVPLDPGLNTLRAVAVASSGLETEDTLTVNYTLQVPSSAIVLTSPKNGVTLGPDDPPVIAVEGRVEDKTLDTVWLVVNDRRIRMSAQDGRFRQVLPVFAPVLRMWAETPANGAPPQRSHAVTIQTADLTNAATVLVMEWPKEADGLDVEVNATWRARADTLDEAIQTIKFAPSVEHSTGRPPAVFYLRGVKPGVYTLILRYRGPAPVGNIHPILYLPGHDGLAPRGLRPISLNGAGKVVVAKVLLPYGVLWDEDEWFTGRSESVDTLTKFRLPEGISWVERKGDPS